MATATSIQLVKQTDQEVLDELGTTGLDTSGGRILEEFLVNLRDRRGKEVYKEMRDNDPTVGAVLATIQMLIRQATWRSEPGEGPDGELAAEFLEECMVDMSDSWTDTISSILSFLAFGFSVHEPVYKKRNGMVNVPGDPQASSRFDDGRIGWKKLPIRAQETIDRWEFAPNTGELIGLTQRAPPDFRPRDIPLDRFLLFRTTSEKANPEGRSILRNAYRPWFFKKRIEEIEGIGVERDLAGLPVAMIPPQYLSPNASAEQKALTAEIKKVLRNVRNDEKASVIFPMARDEDGNSMFEFKLLSSGGSRVFNTSEIINRYDLRISQSMLADFIMLGHEKVGSVVLASEKTNLFGLALGAWLDSITEIFNRWAIPALFERNTFRLERTPELVHGDIETQDLTQLADYVTKLTAVGLIPPTEGLTRHLLAQADLPEPDPEDLEALTQPTQTAAPGSGSVSDE